MADFKTQLYLDQAERGFRRDANANARGIQQPLRYAYFTYTLAGTEANADQILLGSLQTDGAVIVPEASSVWNTGAGDADLDLQLRVGATALTAAASVDNNCV